MNTTGIDPFRFEDLNDGELERLAAWTIGMRTIADAYAEAMKTKRLREASATPVLQRKPHYVLRAGAWTLKHAA